MELTTELLEKILDKKLKNFTTKVDLKNFATKSDLKNFATKEDLKSFATKADMAAQTKELKEFAIEQTESLARIVNQNFVRVEKRMNGLEKSLNELKHHGVY